MCSIFMSLCGEVLTQNYIEEHNLKEEEIFQLFESPEYLVTAEQYFQNPAGMLADPRLMVVIED